MGEAPIPVSNGLGWPLHPTRPPGKLLSLTTENPMNRVRLSLAKSKLCELIRRVERGETVTITRRGKPVAQLVAVGSQQQTHQRSAKVAHAFEQLRRLRCGVNLEGDIQAIAREGLV